MHDLSSLPPMPVDYRFVEPTDLASLTPDIVATLPPHQRAKAQLKAKGYTQTQLAARLGITQSHISYVLNGARISASLLDEIEALPSRKEAAHA